MYLMVTSKIFLKVLLTIRQLFNLFIICNLEKLKTLTENVQQTIGEREELIKAGMKTETDIVALNATSQKVDSNAGSVLKAIKYVKVASNVAAGAIDLVNTIKSGDAEEDKLTKEIEQQENRIKQLHAFEDFLQTEVIPSIGKLGDNLKIAGENMKNQSRVRLNVGKWKVQEMIRDIRLNLKKISKDFDVQEDLLHIFDKLDETMGVMVNVYDRIQVNNYTQHYKIILH